MPGMFPLSRRDFLASLLYSSALVALPAWARIGLKPPGQRKALVIGAGISGLFAASLLEKKGFEVEILEASNHVGGKLLGRKVGPAYFDMGGQALSPDMKRVKTLGKRLGLTLIPRPPQKEFFLQNGQIISGKKVAALRAESDRVQNAITPYFAKLDLPEERKKHGLLSVDAWLKTQKMSGAAEAMFRSTFTAEWCDSPENISFLHYLDFSRSDIGEEGEMDYRFREGFFGMAEALRKELKASVRLETPAQKITVTGEGVTVRSGEKDYTGHFVVLATPAPQMRDIEFAGVNAAPLKDSLAVFQGAFVKKAIVVYAKPFWGTKPREGLFDPPSGLSVMDNSDMEKKVYSIACFLGGPTAALGKDELLARLAEAFGKEALTPLAFDEENWSGSKYMTGGYGSNRRPGAVGYQSVPRQLGDRVLLAGSDTADSFPSYVEGAISSAERAVALLLKTEYRTKVASAEVQVGS
jgi:monoamine oxidase